MAETNKYRATRQSEKLLTLLRSAYGGWVPLPEILALGIAQYNARIFELRRAGQTIENRTERIDGVRHSWFPLVPSSDLSAAPTPLRTAPSESNYMRRVREEEGRAMPFFAGVCR